MKSLQVFLGSIVILFSFQSISSGVSPIQIKNVQRKKIVIFSSTGGAGHISTSKALLAALQKTYEVKIVNTLTEILGPLDPFYRLSGGRYGGEKLYSDLIKSQVGSWFLNKIVLPLGNTMIAHRYKKMEILFDKYLEKEKPAMIISVIPLINTPLLGVAQKHNIPFLVVTNDLDTSLYFRGLNSPTYDKFKYTLAYDDTLLFEKIEPAHFKKEQVEIVGFPVRKDFLEPKKWCAIVCRVSYSCGEKSCYDCYGRCRVECKLRIYQKIMPT